MKKHYLLIILFLPLLFISFVFVGKDLFIHSANIQQTTNVDAILQSTWNGYKAYYITGGRVIRPDQNYDTVSEGQGYAMLRAVYMNDQATFNTVWNWTAQNLSRMNNSDTGNRDHLFAWWYKNGVADWTSATDADEDIAISLAFAGHIWNNPQYISEASAIINDIALRDTKKAADGRLYITGGSYGIYQQNIDIDFSYLAPSYYKVFAQLTGQSIWNQIADTSYQLLSASTQGALATTTGLFPNWASFNPVTLQLSPMTDPNRNTAYTYDAFRTPYRIAEDALWFNDPRAKQILSADIATFFVNQFSSNNKIYGEYNHDGSVRGYYETSCIYGGDIGVFAATQNQNMVTQIVNKILTDYVANNGLGYFGSSTSNYYGNNWAWFGLLMANNENQNLYTASIGQIQQTQTPIKVQTVIPTTAQTPTTITPTQAHETTVSPTTNSSVVTSADVQTLSYKVNLVLNTTQIPSNTYLVDTEIKNSAGQKVGQVILNNLTIKATNYAISPVWQIPENFNPGTYTVDVGIFSNDWSSQYNWTNGVTKIVIQ